MMQDYFVDKAIEEDPRESKLPAWARDKLQTMRRATTEARAELHALKNGTEPGPFWLEGWGDGRKFYLPRAGGRLMFKSGETSLQLTCGYNGHDEEWLNINGCSDGLIAAPHSSNVLLVKNSR